MTIKLPEFQQEWVDNALATGLFPTSDELFSAAVDALINQGDQNLSEPENVRELIAEGMADLEAGLVFSVAEVRDQLREEFAVRRQAS